MHNTYVVQLQCDNFTVNTLVIETQQPAIITSVPSPTQDQISHAIFNLISLSVDAV